MNNFNFNKNKTRFRASMAVRYLSMVRFASIFDKKYGTLVWYALFVKVRYFAMLFECTYETYWISYTSSKNTFKKVYFPEKHLPESTITSNVHFPESTLARNYIFLNMHLTEITFSWMTFCQKSHLPKFTVGLMYIFLKTYFSEFTLARMYTWPNVHCPKNLFSRT